MAGGVGGVVVGLGLGLAVAVAVAGAATETCAHQVNHLFTLGFRSRKVAPITHHDYHHDHHHFILTLVVVIIFTGAQVKQRRSCVARVVFSTGYLAFLKYYEITSSLLKRSACIHGVFVVHELCSQYLDSRSHWRRRLCVLAIHGGDPIVAVVPFSWHWLGRGHQDEEWIQVPCDENLQ